LGKEAKMQCRDCARFDGESGHCRDKKLNPDTWEEAVNVSRVYGIRAVCMFNDHRERLIGSTARTIRPTEESKSTVAKG
jgi:hypothetical protein